MARGRASADDTDQLALWDLGEEPGEPDGAVSALAGEVTSSQQAGTGEEQRDPAAVATAERAGHEGSAAEKAQAVAEKIRLEREGQDLAAGRLPGSGPYRQTATERRQEWAAEVRAEQRLHRDTIAASDALSEGTSEHVYFDTWTGGVLSSRADLTRAGKHLRADIFKHVGIDPATEGKRRTLPADSITVDKWISGRWVPLTSDWPEAIENAETDPHGIYRARTNLDRFSRGDDATEAGEDQPEPVDHSAPAPGVAESVGERAHTRDEAEGAGDEYESADQQRGRADDGVRVGGGAVLGDVPAEPPGDDPGPGAPSVLRGPGASGGRDGGLPGSGQPAGLQPAARSAGVDPTSGDDGADAGRGGGAGRAGVPAEGAGHPGPGDADDADGRVAPLSTAVSAAVRVDFQPAGQGDLAPAGVDAKVQANLAALRLLRRIEAEDRPAASDEQQVLARFAGWGALPKVFVTGDDTYASLREELRGLLSPAEYDDAMQNALNSHFTDAGLVEPMWAALQGLGFESGLVLEAGCGTGNFIGFAPAGARMVGVERNEVSGSIARLLYPSADVRVESFGDTPVRPDTYDSVIGNVPFGNYPVRDRVHNPRNQLLIHDHFISKSLAGLKPGGTMAVITSAGTLDKQLSTVRRGWFEQADLLGAVRLPNAAHRAAAGTEVVTDVLVLRRREPDLTPGDDAWVTSVPTRLNDGTERHTNGYFAAHPENILGTTATGQAAMGREVLAVRPLASDGTLGSQLRERLDVIAAAALAENRGHSPTGTEPRPTTQTPTAQTPAQAPATPTGSTRSTSSAPAPASHEPVRSARTLARAKKVGQITHTATNPVPGKRRGSAGSLRHSFTVVDFDGTEVPYVPDGSVTAGRRTKDGHHPSQADELVSLLRMRDLAADLREAERETTEDTPEIDELRAELNRCYDTYVADYGPINRMKASQKQVKVKDPEDPNQTEGLVEGDDGEWYQVTYTKPGMGGIRKDPTWWSLTGLESSYDEFTNTATKAKFFTQRMVGFRELPAKAESPADAVAISREHDGRVDMDRIAGLLGVNLEEAQSLTRGLVFTDHRTGDLVPAHLFLSGNVRRKAAELEALAKDDPEKWAEAAAAMRAAVPPDKDVTKISAKLGMVWIPAGGCGGVRSRHHRQRPGHRHLLRGGRLEVLSGERRVAPQPGLGGRRQHGCPSRS